MTNHVIAEAMGLVAAVSGNLDDAIVERNNFEIRPMMTISEEMREEERVLPKGVRIEDNRVSVKVSGGYSVPDGFSFDPFEMVLESDLTENGKFGYKIKEGSGDRDEDF